LVYPSSSGCDAPVPVKYDPPIADGKGGWIYYFGADCGKCLMCLKKRKAQWSFRLMEEKRDSFSAYFVTLTLKENYVSFGEDGYSANKQDHLDFVKWLKYFENPKRLKERKSISQEEIIRKRNCVDCSEKLKYYGVQEYGDQEGRPHLHYILFNVHDIGNLHNAWSKQVRISKGKYIPGDSKGKIDIDEVNVNTVDYVLKYMVKQKKEDDYQGKEAERSYMSKGLGSGVINDQFVKQISRVDGNSVVNQRGFKVPLPRYYAKKLLTQDIQNQKGAYIQQELEKKAAKEEKQFFDDGLNPYAVMQQRKESRYNQLKNRRRREIKDYENKSGESR